MSDEPLAEYSYTCDEESVRRLQRGLYRGAMLALMAFVVAVGLVAVYFALTFYRSTTVALAVVVVLVVVMGVAVRRNVFGTLAESAAPGIEYRSRFFEDCFEIEGPLGTTRTPYDTLTDIDVRPGDLVVWQQGGALTSVAFAEVFPPEQVERVRSLLPESSR